MQKSENPCPSTLKRDLRRGERRDIDARQCSKGNKKGWHAKKTDYWAERAKYIHGD